MDIDDIIGEFLRYKYTYRMGACVAAPAKDPAAEPKPTPIATTEEPKAAAVVAAAEAVEPKPKTPRWKPDDARSASTRSSSTRRKRAIPKALKRLVWNTYIGSSVGSAKCHCCKMTDIFQIEFHCGHVKAESKGGETSVENLRPICAQCNLSMGSRDMNEFMSACGFK